MLNQSAIKVIEDILARGNDAQIKRKGNGVIVLEIERKIKYKCDK